MIISWWLSGKESTCQAGDVGSIPGLGRSPGDGNDNLLRYSCLGNPMDRGACWATVDGVANCGHHLAAEQQPRNGFFQGLNLPWCLIIEGEA